MYVFYNKIVVIINVLFSFVCMSLHESLPIHVTVHVKFNYFLLIFFV